MKALIKTKIGKGNLEIMEVPEPEPASNEVKIEIKAAGICGTDVHIYYDEYRSFPPVILGHEFSGVVVEKGKDVKNFNIGDKVSAETIVKVCGKCRLCESGHHCLCPNRIAIGSQVDGCFTKYIVMKEELVHKIPDNIEVLDGALCEPLVCCTHAVIERANVSRGDVVIISGPGTIGLLVVQVAKAEGCTVVLCGTDVDQERLSLGRKIGADFVVNVEKEDPIHIVQELTDDYGADVVFECAGVAKSAEQCIRLAKKTGKYTQIGLFGKPIHIDFDQIAYKELQVIGALSQTKSAWEKSLRFLGEGKVKTRSLISDILPITEWEKGFKMFEEKKGIKIMLSPVD